jgi:hypothetical protein
MKKTPRAPELTLVEAARGRMPRRSAPTRKDESAAENGEGHDVIAAVGLAAKEWRRIRGQSVGARYLLAVPALLDADGCLLPRGTEAPLFNPALVQSNDQNKDVFITSSEVITRWVDVHSFTNI